MSKQTPKHQPVLLEETLQYLRPKAGESYLDLTAGYGGHAAVVLEQTGQPDRAVLVDRDQAAISVLKDRFAEPGIQIFHQDFLAASQSLASLGQHFDMILADLGLSSLQLEDAERGFSLAKSGPLDMRMDRRHEQTAAQIVNRASQKQLASIFSQYGQEPKSQQIAKSIMRARPIKTTDQLAVIAARAWPRGSRIHPATRTFQALRIAVNDELGQLEQALPIWLELLNPGGRLVVISFHSLEDRLVKSFFSDHSAQNLGGELEILTKKPVAANKDEIVSNPRARSAKLRAAAKIKTDRKDHRKAPNAY